MYYTDYQNVRDSVWRLLLDLEITRLPIKPGEVCRRLGISVKFYEPTDDNDGMCLLLDRAPLILVSSKTPVARQRFTVAHELGHLLLGHVGRYTLCNREVSPQDSPIEQAANVFASRLLAPACVLWGCEVRQADQLARLCDISLTAA